MPDGMDLVPNRWYLILSPSEVPSGKPVRHRRFGRDLVFWRDANGQVCAADDRCPHRSAALSVGRVENGEIACPYHGFRFGSEGQCTAIPAHPEMKVPKAMSLGMLVVREAHDFIWAWNGAPEDATGEIPFFENLLAFRYAGSEMRKEWPTHYSRVVENELDWAHLPFVHRQTIGRGYDPNLDKEVQVDQDGDRITTWLTRMGDMSKIDLIAPNIWRMRFSDTVFNFLAFAPIDDERVMIYARTYQGKIKLWPLDRLFALANRLANPVVLAQDFRTVTSQRPKIAGLGRGDVFVPSDKPVLAYLRWREKAKRTGNS